MKTLLVEDDKGTLLILKRLLEKHGHEVDAFEDGESAWVACQKVENYPFVVLDWMLPGMSGLELCRQIRTLPYGSYSFIWIVTAKDQPEDLQAVLDAGANDYLSKPFDAGMFAIRTAIAERQAQVLQKHKKIEEDMQTALEEKSILLHEIHHRVKNNLQVICSLLDLQSRSIRDPIALNAIQESHHRVRSMVLAHETLYYQAKSLSKIEFYDYIDKLAQDLIQFYDVGSRIDLQVTGENILLGVDTAISCGLIVNELVTNSLKYAFPHGQHGKIGIDLHLENGNIQLIVSDSGVGLPTDLDVQHSPSLGLKLVHSLVYQLKGDIKSLSDLGTTFQISFPA